MCRFGRAEGRRTRVHVDRCDESAKDHRRTGADQLAVGHARKHLGQHLRQRARDGDRGHRATDDERRNDRGLIGAGINLQRAHHDAVKGQRAVDVDQAGHDRVLVNELIAKKDLRHRHRILGAGGFGDRPHIGFVRQHHMGQKHVQMALVHRHIGRLTDRAAGMVQPFRHIAQLHEVLEIMQRGVAAAAFGIAHEGRAVNRGKNKVSPANLDIPLGVARMLGEG